MIPLFGPVGPELLIIVAILILLFGAKKIPQLSNSLGKSIGSFKKGRQDIEQELQEMESETQETAQEAKSGAREMTETAEKEVEEATEAVSGSS